MDDGHQADERTVVPVVEVVRALVPEGRQQVEAGERDKFAVTATSLAGRRVTRRRYIDVGRRTRSIGFQSHLIACLVTAFPLLLQSADTVESRWPVVVEPVVQQTPLTLLLLLSLRQLDVGAAGIPFLRRLPLARRRSVQTRMEDVHCREADGHQRHDERPETEPRPETAEQRRTSTTSTHTGRRRRRTGVTLAHAHTSRPANTAHHADITVNEEEFIRYVVVKFRVM